MAPINVYEKKQMEQIRNGIPEIKPMRGFIKVNTADGDETLINVQAISTVDSRDGKARIWLVDRNCPMETSATFNKLVGWIWKAMEV